MWIIIITLIGAVVGIIWDGIRTDNRVDKLEERIKELENK